MPKIALGQTYDVRLASRSEKDALTSISAAPLTRLRKPRAHLLQTAAVVDLPGFPPAAISLWLAIGLMLISLQKCTNDDTKPNTHEHTQAFPASQPAIMEEPSNIEDEKAASVVKTKEKQKVSGGLTTLGDLWLHSAEIPVQTAQLTATAKEVSAIIKSSPFSTASSRPSANSIMATEGYQDPRDLIIRGRYNPTPFGRAVFLILRGIDPLLQYYILSRHIGISWIPRWIGGGLLPSTGTTSTLAPTHPTFFGLALYQCLVLSLAIGSTLKYNWYLVFISRDEMLASSAVIISLFNNLVNSLNPPFATWTFTSINPSASTSAELFKTRYVSASLILYITGILTESIAEIQRHRFKKGPRNKGKPYCGGLFSLARHINYEGFTIWRTGYVMAAAGPAWGLVTGCFFF
ncbi:MAG: hypothetical protein LQ338_001231 [Usnochroma carphineum]|nr:MAG: hypothetical protein LQ338_001231 [Usnochroma carphineum]